MALLSLSETRELLRKYRIPEPKGKLVKTINDCLGACTEIGFPIVLKVVSPEIIHKTDVGGVLKDIISLEDAKDGFERLKRVAKDQKAKFEGVFVQDQIKGYEVLVGGKLDSDFGPTLGVGWGGIYTEILEDISFRVCPVNKKEALEMLKELKVYKLLKEGYRSGSPGDINALVSIILKTSKLMMNEPIKELDFNPVFVLEKGASVADPRIII